MVMASWIFGSLLVVFIMTMVMYRVIVNSDRTIDSTTHALLGFLCSLLAGLFAFFYTGTVAANVAPGTGRFGSIGIQATGGAALFVIVLWWWRSDKSPISAEDTRTLRALAQVFRNIDKIYPGLRGVARPDPGYSSHYRVVAEEESDAIVFRDKNSASTVMRITRKDVDDLSAEDRKFIRVREKSMSKLLDQWSEFYPKRLEGSSEDQSKTKQRLQDLAVEICKDLNGILNHLGSMKMYLEDHYGAARSICAEIENRTQQS
jgi:hypothetical protein